MFPFRPLLETEKPLIHSSPTSDQRFVSVFIVRRSHVLLFKLCLGSHGGGWSPPRMSYTVPPEANVFNRCPERLIGMDESSWDPEELSAANAIVCALLDSGFAVNALQLVHAERVVTQTGSAGASALAIHHVFVERVPDDAVVHVTPGHGAETFCWFGVDDLPEGYTFQYPSDHETVLRLLRPVT